MYHQVNQKENLKFTDMTQQQKDLLKEFFEADEILIDLEESEDCTEQEYEQAQASAEKLYFELMNMGIDPHTIDFEEYF